MATQNPGFKIYLTPEQAEELRRISETEQRSITGIIRLLVADYLAKRESTAAASPLT